MRELFEVASKGAARTSSINLLEIEPTHWATTIRRLAQFKLAEAMSSPVISLMVAREVEKRGGRGLSKDELRDLIEGVYPDAFRVRLR
jgi:hypothetical protein